MKFYTIEQTIQEYGKPRPELIHYSVSAPEAPDWLRKFRELPPFEQRMLLEKLGEDRGDTSMLEDEIKVFEDRQNHLRKEQLLYLGWDR